MELRLDSWFGQGTLYTKITQFKTKDLLFVTTQNFS